MSIEIVQGTTRKPVATEQLKVLLSQQPSLSGQLFIGYPVIGTIAGRQMIDALLVSADKGIVLFDLIEGNELSDDYTSRQDDSANKLEARLKPHSELMDRRKLLIPINVVSFAPGTSNLRKV